MVKRLHLLIRGRVQGVCFRMYAREEATALGLTGWVRNLRTGDVEVVAEGPEEGLEKLAAWCRRGPDDALVTDVQEAFAEPTGEFDAFRISH